MNQRSYLIVDHTVHDKKIEAVQGDLTAPVLGDDVDVLVVSAFPDDYTPTRGSLIGALHQRGLSVEALARRKALDLRRDFSCWLSEPLDRDYPWLRATRILCFEPAMGEPAVDRVDHIFRALAPIIGAEPKATSIAMPLVACGDQGVPVEEIMAPLVRSAVHWMQSSPLHYLRIAEFEPARAAAMRKAFEHVKDQIQAQQAPQAKTYDVFISYCQENMAAADTVETMLRGIKPGVKIFRDMTGLQAGRDYPAQLDKAIRDTRRVVPLYTPAYLASAPCQREFNDAWNLRGRGQPDLLFPLRVLSSDIQDPRMRDLQYTDCVEMDTTKIDGALRCLVAGLT